MLSRHLSRRVAAAAAPALLRPTAPALMWANESVRRRNNFEALTSRPNDFDIDKEKWGKQMQFASMECVLDPNVAPISLRSFTGIRKRFTQWVSMRKLHERRPTFKVDDLMQIFMEYKILQNSLDPEKYKLLSRLTTFAEAERLAKEGTAELHARMKSSSWRAIASPTAATAAGAQQQQQQGAKRQSAFEKMARSSRANAAAPAAAGGASTSAATAASASASAASDEPDKAAAAAATPASPKGAGKKGEGQVLARGAATPNMAGVVPYEIEIDKFDITNCFIGQMTSEDWIQITVKAEYREKNASVGPLANKVGGHGSTAAAAAEALRKRALYQHQMASQGAGEGAAAGGDGQREWTRLIEFPVFEVKLGDGVSSANTQPFTVVAVMDKDGSRHGKDGNDATLLRKQFSSSKRSMFGLGR